MLNRIRSVPFAAAVTVPGFTHICIVKALKPVGTAIVVVVERPKVLFRSVEDKLAV
jgi:hypothetical protein